MQRQQAAILAVVVVVLTVSGAQAKWFFEDKGSRSIKPARPTQLPDGQKCGIVYKEYIPSPLERDWASAAEQWSRTRNKDLTDLKPYCKQWTKTAAATEQALSCVGAAMKSNVTLAQCEDADSVLSKFKVHVECHNRTLAYYEHIEPITAAVRHPNSIKCDPDPGFSDKVMSVEHLLFDSWIGGGKYAPKKYYFDLGASGDWPDLSQKWLVETYEKRGIVFDRMFLYEAIPLMGNKVHEDVPKRFYPAFQYFNFPAPADLDDPRNPLNIIRALARPEDFVVFKLDIDAFHIEKAWTDHILSDPTMAELIDEMMFEHHFQLAPLVQCCWKDSADPNAYLKDSYALFAGLRQKGIRSHYWP